MNKTIKKVQTGFFPHTVEFTRIVVRNIRGKDIYTVAIKNNCIQGNYTEQAQAEAHFARLTK